MASLHQKRALARRNHPPRADIPQPTQQQQSGENPEYIKFATADGMQVARVRTLRTSTTSCVSHTGCTARPNTGALVERGQIITMLPRSERERSYIRTATGLAVLAMSANIDPEYLADYAATVEDDIRINSDNVHIRLYKPANTGLATPSLLKYVVRKYGTQHSRLLILAASPVADPVIPDYVLQENLGPYHVTPGILRADFEWPDREPPIAPFVDTACMIVARTASQIAPIALV